MIWYGIIASIVAFEWNMKKKMDKKLDFEHSIKRWNGKLILKKYHNKGAALDLFSQHQEKLIFGTCGLILGLLFWLHQLVKVSGQGMRKLALSFLLGGAISNAWDRITKHYVVDYFSFSWKKIRHIVFNIADFFIFIGSLLLVISFLKEKNN